VKKRSYSFILSVTALLVLMLVSSFNYFVDPFTYYHQPWTDINYSQLHRFSNPGLARQYDYQAVLVGTSHFMELESSRFSEIIGVPGLNLSTNGGLFREQSELVELILDQGKADTIYWEMNFPSLSLGDATGSLGQQYPEYFYHPTVETPFRYLASLDTLVHSWKAVNNPGVISIDNRNELVHREFSERRVMASWEREIQRWSPELRNYWLAVQSSVDSSREVLEKRLVPLLESHPQVSFKLILPPHTLMFFLLREAMGADGFNRWLEFRKTLGELADQYPNAELYDFQADWVLVEDFELYRDIEHFSYRVLETVFENVRDGENSVSRDRLLGNNQALRDKVYAFGRELCKTGPDRCTTYLEERLASPLK
jgi:hypothetical protein